MIFVGGVLKAHIFLFIFLPLCFLLYSWAIGKTFLWIYTFSFNLSSSSVSIVVTRRTCKTHWWRKIKKTLLKPRKRSTKKKERSQVLHYSEVLPRLQSCPVALYSFFTLSASAILEHLSVPTHKHRKPVRVHPWLSKMPLKHVVI